MLDAIDEDGLLTWTCRHRTSEAAAQCGLAYQHPHTHPEIVVTGIGVVALPPCTCGARTFLKVQFTEAELRTPNMWIAWDGEQEGVLRERIALAAQWGMTPVLESAIAELQAQKAAGGRPTGSYHVARRHMALARHLDAAHAHDREEK